MTTSKYRQFLRSKGQIDTSAGFDPVWMPDFLFDFQRVLVEWAIKRGRAALFADCGMGKTPMQLVWAQNVVEHTNKSVLILTPLAVAAQTEREAAKFGIPALRANRSVDSEPTIVITNYEKLHHFDPDQFSGVVCDESGILKNYAGATRRAITEFAQRMDYRLLATATAAPNDHMELGTSSEALGNMRRVEMLAQFFTHDGGDTQRWRMKRHGSTAFWRWVASWARACRKPSDLGFDDGKFILPPMGEAETVVDSTDATRAAGLLFPQPALGINEQRKETRRTLDDRCGAVADLVNGTGAPALVWCHLNDEGNRLAKLIPDAVQISGADKDEAKEERFESFIKGDSRVLVTKPRIGGWGLNFQHCCHVVTFPSNSFESYYQTIRRCWRFGQTKPVHVDVVMTEGDRAVRDNMKRKEAQAEEMFELLVREMNHAIQERPMSFATKEEMPSWL